MKRNGFSEARDPILKPLDTIECRDAILGPDADEPDWPTVDAVIGNPPFLGYSQQRERLGDEYIEAVRRLYKDKIPAFADLVCYWFHKAGRALAEGKITRAGLVATNSIRGGKNRKVLDSITKDAVIFDAWANEPWTLEGAAVHISLVSFASQKARLSIRLDGTVTDRIAPDLTSSGSDLTTAVKLARNRDTDFVGNQKKRPFDIQGDLAR